MSNNWLSSWAWRKQSEQNKAINRMEGRMEKLVNIGVSYGKSFPADRLYVWIELSGHHDERDECTREYNRVLGQVRDALMGIGIPEDEIKNSDFKVSVHTKLLYEKDDGRYYRTATELDGYDYSAKMSVRRDATQEEAKAIWIALCSCEDPVQFRLSYGIKDTEALKTTLLSEAVEEGRRRAEILATAAGAKLKGVHSISYEYDDDGYRSMADACAPSGSSAYDDAPEFNPDDVYVECDVRMQWAMEV